MEEKRESRLGRSLGQLLSIKLNQEGYIPFSEEKMKTVGPS